jgi:hypothetical protein
VALLLAVRVARAQEIQQLRTYYFGNSFTGNTMPGLHPLLGESAGKQWTVQASIAPGIPIWAHMKKQMDKGPDYEKFHRIGAETDAIVMLIFGGDGLSYFVTEKWQGKVKFDKVTDIGDIAACSYLIRQYLKLNPDGRAYIYTAWPGIPGVKDLRARIQEEAIQSAMRPGEPRRDVMKRIKKRKPNHEEMEPLRKSLDYASLWLNEGYEADLPKETRNRLQRYRGLLTRSQRPSAPNVTLTSLAEAGETDEATVRADLKLVRWHDKPVEPPALQEAIDSFLDKAIMTHCRQHMWAVMDGLIKKFPELWKEGRLGMVPVGDVFLALDEKIRAGKVPGLVNIGEYSADGGHLRSGLPRYTLGATYYAVLFREHPGKVDWKIFQDRSNYDSGKYGFYVHQPDLAVHLDITPERARAVNDTIWEVVSEHAYTGVQSRTPK